MIWVRPAPLERLFFYTNRMAGLDRVFLCIVTSFPFGFAAERECAIFPLFFSVIFLVLN
jgi:hypothetical protein